MKKFLFAALSVLTASLLLAAILNDQGFAAELPQIGQGFHQHLGLGYSVVGHVHFWQQGSGYGLSPASPLYIFLPAK